MLIVLRVRRVRCLNSSCPAATFAEQADGLTSGYCQRRCAR